jgi:hypothetical protein
MSEEKTNPALNYEHIDAACAWLNVEGSVVQEIAERDFGLTNWRSRLMFRKEHGRSW